MRFSEASRKSNDDRDELFTRNSRDKEARVLFGKRNGKQKKQEIDEQCGVESNINNSREQRREMDRKTCFDAELVASPFRMMH